MIHAKDKGIVPKDLAIPPEIPKKSELSYLPKYICYKAALLREKLVLSYVVAVLSLLFIVYFVISRIEISHLHDQLRAKEYILAPGVLDFTPASPQAIPDSYVHDAATDFISSLGNINASNIEEEYSGLKRFMSDTFKIQFEVETKPWITQVQHEDLAQIINIERNEIMSDQKGAYRATAFVRADFYAAGQYIGHENQVIEMDLTLVPPERGKRWFLQITNLNWSKLENFKNRAELKKSELKKESK